jgi:Eukaryotic protein of unknown function (DUF866)
VLCCAELLQVKDSSSDESRDEIFVSTDEVVEMNGSKGTANFVMKWAKDSRRESSINVHPIKGVTRDYTGVLFVTQVCTLIGGLGDYPCCASHKCAHHDRACTCSNTCPCSYDQACACNNTCPCSYDQACACSYTCPCSYDQACTCSNTCPCSYL